MKMKPTLLVLLLLGAVRLLAEEPQVIALWPQGAPGFEARRNEPEQVGSYWVRNIHNPSLTVFPAPKAKANGARSWSFRAVDTGSWCSRRKGSPRQHFSMNWE